jgi:hypothetical protein
MMKRNKGQSAIEFLIIVGVASFMFLIFLIAIQNNISDETDKNRNFILKEIALTVQHEIKLAYSSVDGYRREFELPLKITNLDYEIDFIHDFVYVRTTDLKYALSLPVEDVGGDIYKGENVITRNDGFVYLNQ